MSRKLGQESLAAMKVKDVDILSHGCRMSLSAGLKPGYGIEFGWTLALSISTSNFVSGVEAFCLPEGYLRFCLLLNLSPCEQ